MSTRTYHRITETGQIIRCTTSEQLITNPGAILTQLIAASSSDDSSSDKTAIRTLYNLGDGVSAFRQKNGPYTTYWNSIQIENLPFLTPWELCQDPTVNGGRHFICPWDGSDSSKQLDIGAPMVLPIPEDLIIHFHVEYQRVNAHIDIQLPEAGDISRVAEQLMCGIHNYYLTCFSQSRNTCVHLPLPNLYEDCHLCVGSSFDTGRFFRLRNHAGLVNSVRSFVKAWSDTKWNRDLLDGSDSTRMAQYRRFVRFDADTGNPLPFEGCTDWDRSTSPVPLEAVYKPWSSAPTAQPEEG